MTVRRHPGHVKCSPSKINAKRQTSPAAHSELGPSNHAAASTADPTHQLLMSGKASTEPTPKQPPGTVRH